MVEPLDLYGFSLYCEGHGATQSTAFATLSASAEEATTHALAVWRDTFPPADGWTNHQAVTLLIPRDRIRTLVSTWDDAEP